MNAPRTAGRLAWLFTAILLPLLVACGGSSTPTTLPPIPSPTVVPSPLPITAPTPPAMALPTFQKGITYASFFAGQYSDPESEQVLADGIRALGADWVSLIVTCYQDTITSVQITCAQEDTPTDSDLIHAIATAHRLGMKVMLKPHIDLYREKDPTAFRGDISSGNDEIAWRAWFANYTTAITHYAQVAQNNRADAFVVGTELVHTSSRATDWRAVVRAVRAIYRGPITYAANFDEDNAVQWWDAVDFIGIDAYYPLAQKPNPTVAELVAAWSPISARLAGIASQWKRRIVFTEVGYQSRAGTARKPSGITDEQLDLQEQADCYEAVFQALNGQTWWSGAYWWVVLTNTSQGGPQDTDYSLIGKPAADVVRRYYGGGPRG